MLSAARLASGGKNNMRRRTSPMAQLASPQARQRATDEKDHDRAGDSKVATHEQLVALRARVVSIAAQDHPLERGADLAVGGFEQRQLELPRRELDAVEIARHLGAAVSVGSEHHQRSHVSELSLVVDVGVAKTVRVRERVDLVDVPGQKGPRCRGRPPYGLQKSVTLL